MIPVRHRVGQHDSVASRTSSLTDILTTVDAALVHGRGAAPAALPTGFGILDTYLGGGVRAGELVLLGGPQGIGKTFFALQMLREAATVGGGAIYITFEHDATTVLGRLIAAEAGKAAGPAAVSLHRVRSALESVDGGVGGLSQRLSGQLGAREASAAVDAYGSRFFVHEASGSDTDMGEIAGVVRESRASLGAVPLVVVDYLQKVAVPGGPSAEAERVTMIVEGLKDMALDLAVPILAVVAADKDGLGGGTRLRTHHLRGSSALAYEPDVVLVLQDKYDVVARHHLSFDVTGAERFREWVVLSIEKNRSGLDRVDVEFRKHLGNGFFEPSGRAVQETLVDGRVYVE